MITENIRFAPETSLISGNRIRAESNRPAARTSSEAPSAKPHAANRTLFPSTTLYRRAVAQKTSGPENQDQDQDGKDDYIRPANADVLVAHRADDADKDTAHDRPGEVSYAAQDRCREREEPLPEAHIEDGGAVEEPKHV